MIRSPAALDSDCQPLGCLTIPKCVDNECVKELEELEEDGMDTQHLKDTILAMNEVSRAGLDAGLEIGRREGAVKVQMLRAVLEQIYDELMTIDAGLHPKIDVAIELAGNALAKGTANV